MDALSSDHSLQSHHTNRSRLVRTICLFILTAILLPFIVSCVNVPRPTISISPVGHNPPAVGAEIVPNQFEVTDVVLEFERQGIWYDSTLSSYNFPRSQTRSLPTTQPFHTAFKLTTSQAPPFVAGEVIKYQFRVTHLTAENSFLYWW